MVPTSLYIISLVESVAMLSAIMRSVAMLNVVAPCLHLTALLGALDHF
jgi:hypothetical protein